MSGNYGNNRNNRKDSNYRNGRTDRYDKIVNIDNIQKKHAGRLLTAALFGGLLLCQPLSANAAVLHAQTPLPPAEVIEIEDLQTSELARQPFFQPDSTCSFSTGKKLEPIFRVLTDKPQVSLTFDAAWNNTYTDSLLAIMAKYNVKSTYFMTGNWIRDYPDEVNKLLQQGHELANHSQSHRDFRSLSAAQMTALIQGAHAQVKDLTSIDMCLFRAPSGEYNNSVVQTATDNGYYYIQWTIDSLDWKNYGADDIVNRVLNSPKLAPGAIILLHDGAKYTPAALERIIVGLQEKGYELVPVSQMIYRDHFHMDIMGNQISDLP